MNSEKRLISRLNRKVFIFHCHNVVLLSSKLPVLEDPIVEEIEIEIAIIFPKLWWVIDPLAVAYADLDKNEEARDAFSP